MVLSDALHCHVRIHDTHVATTETFDGYRHLEEAFCLDTGQSIQSESCIDKAALPFPRG